MTTGFHFLHRIAQMFTDECSLFGVSKFTGIPKASFRGGCLGHPPRNLNCGMKSVVICVICG